MGRPKTRHLRVIIWAAAVAVLIAVVSVVLVTRGTTPQAEGYPLHPDVTASVFSPYENPNPSNAFISNAESAWDKDWRKHAPHENQFFVALPYADYLNNESFNPDNSRIPWHKANQVGQSELKNSWVEVTREADGRTLTAYGQWEDVGPSAQTDAHQVSDPDYVFGPVGHDPTKPITTPPKNTFGLRAGIDLSTEMAAALGIDANGSGIVSWRFVDRVDVPLGPWFKVITTSGYNQ